MRFQTLTEMLSDLRGEAGISQNVAHGVTSTNPHTALIRRVQEELYHAYDWPHLRTTAVKAISAGQRYAAYPDTFDFDGITDAWARDLDNRWAPVAYGIGPMEYNLWDSGAGEQFDPIQRWANYMQDTGDTSNNMFEVWPLPVSDTEIMFRGKRKIFPLDDGDKTSTLDGPLIVLFAAVELLAAQKADDATLKLQKAQDRLKWLKTRATAPDSRVTNLGGRSPVITLRPGLDYMPRRG